MGRVEHGEIASRVRRWMALIEGEELASLSASDRLLMLNTLVSECTARIVDLRRELERATIVRNTARGPVAARKDKGVPQPTVVPGEDRVPGMCSWEDLIRRRLALEPLDDAEDRVSDELGDFALVLRPEL